MILQSPVRIAVLAGIFVLPLLDTEAHAADEAATDGPYSRKGADTCIACHDDAETLGVFRTKHAVPTDPGSPFGSGQLQCEACHGPGGAHSPRVRRGEERPPVIKFGSHEDTSVDVQNGMCMNCHSSDVGVGWHGGPHDNDDVACADCHVSHTPRDAVLQTSMQTEVCFDCHQLQRSETLKAYSHPFFERKMDCSGCHSPHGDSANSQFARQTLNDTCYQCHAEKRGPYLREAEAGKPATVCSPPCAKIT